MYSKRSKLFLFVALLVALSLVFTACQAATEEPTEEPEMEEEVEPTEAMEEEEPEEEMEEQVFKLGILGPFSGPSAQTGKQFRGGATIALEKWDYTVGPYTIEPVWIDSQSDPAKATQAYEQAVVQDGIQAGALNWHSSVAVAVMEVTAKHQVPHIFGFGATEKVNETFESDVEKYGYWSTKGWPTPGKLGTKYADALEYYIDEGVYSPENKTVAIYGEDTDWGRSFGADIKTLFEDAGWEIVSEEYFPLEQTEYYPYLNSTMDENPAVLAGTSTSPPQITSFIKQADEVGLMDDTLIIADGLGWVDFCGMTGESADKVIDQIAGWSGEEGFAFAEEFESRYNLSPSTSSAGLAHDGTLMFLQIAQAAYDEYGELTSENIQKFVEENVWTGEWTMTNGIVMKEYQYTDETIPDPVVGPGYYTFPVLQYEYEEGNCNGKAIFPAESAVQDLLVP